MANTAYAQSCAERIGSPDDITGLLKENANRYDWECKDTVGTEITQNQDGTKKILHAKIPVPIHNGEREFNYNFFARCEVGYADYSDGILFGNLGYILNRAGGDAFWGYRREPCGSFSGVSPPAFQMEQCLKKSRFIGTIKTEFLSENPGCPGAPIVPYTPPTVNLEVTQIREVGIDKEFYSVNFASNAVAGRYEIKVLEWDYGNGLTHTEGTLNDREGTRISYDAFTTYDKPIISAAVSLNVIDASGTVTTQSIPVYFTDPEKPIAGFESEILGRRLKIKNQSEHPKKQSMTYQWYFGDGASSNEEDPTHIYDEAGTYNVSLTVTDVDGDIDMADAQVTAENGLFIGVNPEDPIMDVEATQNINVEVLNFETDDIDNFDLGTQVDSDFLVFEGRPSPAILKYIPKNGSIQTRYRVAAKQSGDVEMTFTGKGILTTGERIEAKAQSTIFIQPDLDIELSTSATSETRAGEEVTITLTITNNDNDTINGIRVDSLMVSPHRLLTFISGPLDPNGVDPRVSALSLGAGQSTTVTWTYLANERGVAELRAFLTADRVRGNGRVAHDTSGTLAIETAAFELSQLRIVGGTLQSPRVQRPKPGTFNFIRGTITNVGGVDIMGIDFELKSSDPLVVALGNLINRLSSDVSPEIAVLKPGKANSREFIIPISMVSDVSDKTRFVLPIEFSGKAMIDEEEVDVITRQELRGNIDRDKYHIDILPEVKSLLLSGFISFIQGVDQVGNDTTVGGVTVGGAEGVLRALQKMGDGAFTAKDLVVDVGTFISNTAEDGGEALSEDALKIYNVIVEYNESTSLKQKAFDLAEGGESLSNSGVRVIADWMNDVEKAGRDGDYREVAALLTESGTNIGTGVGAEKASATLLARIVEKFPARKFLRGKEKKAKTLKEDSPQPEVVDFYRGQEKAWDDVPPGVPLTGNSVRLAGLSDEQYAYLIDKAKETGGTFIVRPRPETATKWALQRLNAKPMAIKLKSVNEIDSKWLGFDKADEGLIHMREPKDPLEAMKAAVERGELEPGGPEIDRIIDRYNQRRAEFNTRDEYLDNLNSKKAQILDKDGNVISEGDGIVVLREGKPIITKVSVDSDGFLTFDFNNRRVYSDIDLLSFGKADGSNLPKNLHEDVLKESAFGIDLQHGAPAQTSDFNNFQSAARTADEQLYQHRPGGDGGGLIIIGPNQTTKGFVNSYKIASEAVNGSNYDLYGKVVTELTLIGGNTR